MHHQILISLGPGGITTVIVDAMSVERQGGIAKQQHRIWKETALRQGSSQIGGQRVIRPLRAGHRIVPVHQILPFRHKALPRDSIVMADGDKAQRPRLSGLEGDRFHRAVALHLIAVAKRPAEQHLAPGPHPARQGQARQDQAQLRMPVPAQIGRGQRIGRQGPEQPKRHAFGHKTVGQRGTKLFDQARRYRVGPADPAADPRLVRVVLPVSHDRTVPSLPRAQGSRSGRPIQITPEPSSDAPPAYGKGITGSTGIICLPGP